MDLSKLKSIGFQSRVTTIDRRHTDKLIKLADEFNKSSYQRMEKSADDDDFDVTAFQEYYIEAPQTAFCLYCLAIINCYALVENNRNEILKKRFHKMENLEDFFKKKNISHKDIKHYKTEDKFRLINNAIKHDRLSTTKTIKDKNGKEYGLEDLKTLYKYESANLEKYLADLYRFSLEVGLRTE